MTVFSLSGPLRAATTVTFDVTEAREGLVVDFTLDYLVTVIQVRVEPGGTLSPGGEVQITVSINDQSEVLKRDHHEAVIADPEPNLFIRWGYDPGNPASGWNIDDIEIWGVVKGSVLM